MVISIVNIIYWIIVPGIMIALFIWALKISANASETVSSWAGFWGGLLITVIYVISQFNKITEPNFAVHRFPGFLFSPFIFGFIIGFIFLWIIKAVRDLAFVGIISLLLSSASTSAFFTYVFFESVRSNLIYFILGIGLGVLLHLVFMPHSLSD